jgi:uncharacterized protein (DUF934 family)
MPLIKGGAVVADPWRRVADDEAPPAGEGVVVSFQRWQKERDSLLGRNAPLGLALANADPVEALGPDIGRFALIVLHFPRFTDGRAYSQARILRERFGYQGELRATGNVLRDQLLFMTRCGFDAFETDARGVAAFQAALAEITHAYQPAGPSGPPLLRRYAKAG